MAWQRFSSFPLHPAPDYSPWQTFEHSKCWPGPVSGHEEPSLANWPAICFPSTPGCSGTRTGWTLSHSANFNMDWWQTQTSLEYIWKLWSALMCAWLSERMQMFDLWCPLLYSPSYNLIFRCSHQDCRSQARMLLSALHFIHTKIFGTTMTGSLRPNSELAM